MNKIAILICYYGKFPWYFPYFLHSCRFNTTVDFFIFSDVECTIPLPSNVIIVHKTINDIKKLASDKLGINVNIDFPYKLCDFKPAYGLFFSEYIQEYEFWGQSDIDIIYGDIRCFITLDLLAQYDYISIRHDYTTGCFALYRNNSFVNNLFKRSKDYVKVFSDNRHYCFDECNFSWDLLMEGKSIFEIETEIESFTHIIKTAESNGEIRAHFDFLLVEGTPGRIKFDKGKITYKDKFEAILYHLILLKRVYTPSKIPKTIPDSFKISPTRIYR